MSDDKSNINLNTIRKLEKSVEGNLKSLYTDVKFTDPVTVNTIEYMRNKMNRGIDKLINNNISNSGLSNISSLYNRTMDVQQDKSIINSIADTFENEELMGNVMSLYSDNTFLRDLDKEIDTVCKYMPKLCDALDTRKEHVLSADHFSKTSINIKNSSSSDTDISAVNNIKEMKEKYDIDDLMDRIYTEADYKGECFVYIVPYKKAIGRLIAPELDTGTLAENNTITTSKFTYVSESTMYDSKCLQETALSPFNETYDGGGLDVTIDKSGVLHSAVELYKKAGTFLNETASLSVNEAKDNNMNIEAEVNKNKEGFYNTSIIAADGFKVLNNKNQVNKELNIPGCVVKILDRSMVKPLYIDDICLGYFYLECDKEMDLNQTSFTNTLGGGKSGNRVNRSFDDNNKESAILKKIASDISTKIDNKFINANQDLTKEIYFILKYNRDIGANGKINKVRVTFIPPEDMVHAYFNKDPKTNRGISGLYKALFPAKLFSCLYISNTLTILTRGQDKRIYYIKQSVDTNIAGVMLNTINQIKKSNFGLRQIENMNNIFNITGKFNDHIVPKSPTGEAPVDIEIMPGQNVDVKTDLMNMLEEMAVNSTDVPLEIIQARQQLDFATHYTMSNSKFLKKVYNRQTKFKRISDKVISKIYNAEFSCEDVLETELPPPMYLNLTNTSQLFQAANEMAQSSIDMYAGDEAQEVQLDFGRSVKKYFLSSFLPVDEFEKFLDRARMKAKVKTLDDPQ